jgi:hypothetical protein
LQFCLTCPHGGSLPRSPPAPCQSALMMFRKASQRQTAGSLLGIGAPFPQTNSFVNSVHKLNVVIFTSSTSGTTSAAGPGGSTMRVPGRRAGRVRSKIYPIGETMRIHRLGWTTGCDLTRALDLSPKPRAARGHSLKPSQSAHTGGRARLAGRPSATNHAWGSAPPGQLHDVLASEPVTCAAQETAPSGWARAESSKESATLRPDRDGAIDRPRAHEAR